MAQGLTRVLVAFISLVCLASASCVAERPRATVAGWRANVVTLAGDGSPGWLDDAAARRARFGEPFGVAVGADGSVYVADGGESNRIRRLTPEGAVVTLAGGGEGFADGLGAAAQFNTPSGLAVDGEGNLYVADTGNHRVRKVTPAGIVSTLAGDGRAGFREGPAAQAQFNAPVGVAVGRDGQVYVADTYNDRVRVITKSGEVRTVAGAGRPGHADGPALEALFDTPCAVSVSDAGELYVADTGNNRLRKLTKEGAVVTVAFQIAGGETDGESPRPAGEINEPAGLALTHDGFLYATELERGRIIQVAPDGAAHVIAGAGLGFADGEGRAARFNHPAGVALRADGSLVVADSANYLVRAVLPPGAHAQGSPGATAQGTPGANATMTPSAVEVLPRITVEGLGNSFPWPLDPQDRPHEVSATMGEVRGTYDSDDSRHHLHSGIDVFGVYGQTVRAVFDEKVSSPLSNWGFGSLNEGFRAHLITYVHLRVGRDEKDAPLDGSPFLAVTDDAGKAARVRVRRGTRLRVGDALGTVNRMYHVHMNLGPPGAELNPLALPLVAFTDRVAPQIERDGVTFLDASGNPLKEKRGGRTILRGAVRVVVDAFDRADANPPRRRLGLYRLGYQLLASDGATPAAGFETPRINIEFNRLPPDREATKVAYADQSGITVYGSQATRFLYETTNTVRDGRAARGVWDTSELPPGDYVLRILASDFHGNEAAENHLVPITIER